MTTISEQQLHIACVKWTKIACPHLFFYHIPNGGKREVKEGVLLKAMGTVAGIPDLHIPELNLYIEIKCKTGKTSMAQESVMFKLREAGCICHVIYDIHQYKDIILTMMKYRQVRVC